MRRSAHSPAALASLALLVATLGAAAPARAQDRSGTIEISPFGGAYLGGRLYAGSNGIFSRDVDVKAAGTYGLRLAMNVSRTFGIEAGFSTAKADIQAPGGGGLFQNTQKLGELELRHYELDAVFNLGRRRVIPYIAIGAGATTFEASVPGYPKETDTRFTGNLGVGVKVFFNPHVALRFDGRARAARVDDSRRCSTSYTGYCDGGYDYRDRNDLYWSGEATGGLTFAF